MSVIPTRLTVANNTPDSFALLSEKRTFLPAFNLSDRGLCSQPLGKSSLAFVVTASLKFGATFSFTTGGFNGETFTFSFTENDEPEDATNPLLLTPVHLRNSARL